jgi:chemotaxis protein methyltransferase CheR
MDPLTTRGPLVGPRQIGSREFARFQEWILRETGIHLTEAKQALLVGRLWRRVRELGLPSYAAYLDLVESGVDGGERVRLVNAICTHETHFFREPRQFEYLERTLVPQWQAEAKAGRRSKQVRVWSAACSSGEEPYSAAMSLLNYLPAEEGWNVDVLATDISTQVLEKAKTGVYPMSRAESIPSSYLKRFMLRGRNADEGRFAVGGELREAVKFRQFNLNDEQWTGVGNYDAIFCRNVLIYFNPEGRATVLKRLTSLLAPGGHLFLGHAESLGTGGHGLKVVMPTVYAAPARAASAA